MRDGVYGVIYAITCEPTGEQYVGRSMDLEYRWRVHLSRLRCHRHPNGRLQAAYDTYGREAFRFSVIEKFMDETSWMGYGVCWSYEERERYWIWRLKPAFNVRGKWRAPISARALAS